MFGKVLTIHLTLIGGRLYEGIPAELGNVSASYTTQNAWAQLLLTGEVHLSIQDDSLQELRLMYADWVFGQGAIT